PDTAQQGGDEKQREAEAGDDEEQEPQVLRGQRDAEEVEAALGDVEEHGRMVADLDPRERQVEGDEPERRPAARRGETSVRVRGKQERPRTVALDRRYRLERRAGVRVHPLRRRGY